LDSGRCECCFALLALCHNGELLLHLQPVAAESVVRLDHRAGCHATCAEQVMRDAPAANSLPQPRHTTLGWWTNCVPVHELRPHADGSEDGFQTDARVDRLKA